MPSSRTEPAAGFASLGLAPSLLEAVTALGYEEPTPVQREAIPVILAARNLLAQAATGTGKTAAFILPMIQRLIGEDAPPPRSKARRHTRGLVLVPTRELAMQVAEATHKYARGSGITVVPIYGGASLSQQVRALDRGADIVIATPGRALDHLRRESLVLEHLKVLVLDEADEMLDMGFAEDLDAILEATPAERQTALFSATMPARLRTIAERHLKDAVRVVIEGVKTAPGKMPRVRQLAYVVGRAHKPAALQRVLDMESPTSALVFCRTRLEVDELVETLNSHGYRAEALHGGMQQRQRDAVMARFRAANVDLLIATDVAARGLDITQLSHVFNYDVPSEPEAYIHRIGRTGRAGREGTAITFAEPREHRLLRNIERTTRQRIEVATLPTLADLRARQLDATQSALRERLMANDFDDVRVVVQSLASEFDIVDIAAAAIKLAHAATAGDREETEVPIPAPIPESRGAGPDRPGSGRPSPGRPPRSRATGEPMARLFVGAGRRAGMRPADLVGALTNEAGLRSRDVGAIEIAESFSLVEVPEALADGVITTMRGASLRGLKVQIRRDRDSR